MWVDFRKELIRIGVDLDCWDKSYKIARDTGYNLEKHITELKKLCDEDNNIKKIENLAKTKFSDLSKYLFEDSVPFLKKLKQNGDKVYLLSFGNPSWQHFKVERTQIDSYFNDFFYQEKEGTKIDKILEFKKDIDKIIVIDNSAPQLDAIKEKLPNVQTYLINRVPANLMEPKNEEEKLKFLSARKYALQKPKYKHTPISNLDNIKLPG